MYLWAWRSLAVSGGSLLKAILAGSKQWGSGFRGRYEGSLLSEQREIEMRIRNRGQVGLGATQSGQAKLGLFSIAIFIRK